MTKCCSSSRTSRPATKCEVTWTWTFKNHLSLTLLTHAKPSQNCYSMQKSKPICFFVEADSENNNGSLIAFFPTQLRIMPLSSGRRHNTLLTLLSCTSGHHPVLVESKCILFHAKLKYIYFVDKSIQKDIAIHFKNSEHSYSYETMSAKCYIL